MEESSRVNENMVALAALRLPEGLASMLPPEPTAKAEMRDSPERDLWEAATTIEMEGLINNGVWDQVALPAGEKAVGTKFVFKRKVDENGEIEKYKARFVVKGL